MEGSWISLCLSGRLFGRCGWHRLSIVNSIIVGIIGIIWDDYWEVIHGFSPGKFGNLHVALSPGKIRLKPPGWRVLSLYCASQGEFGRCIRRLLGVSIRLSHQERYVYYWNPLDGGFLAYIVPLRANLDDVYDDYWESPLDFLTRKDTFIIETPWMEGS